MDITIFLTILLFACLYITPSHYHRCANLSEDIEPMRYLSDILCRVRLSIFSQLSIIRYVGLCVLIEPFPLCIYIYTLSCCHYQMGSMSYYSLYMVRS